MPPSKVQALMDGVKTMSKAELVIELEKHKQPVSGASKVSDLRYTLMKYYEEHGGELDDSPPKKKAKADAGDATGGGAASAPAPSPGVVPAPTVGTTCPLGGACPELHSMSHRIVFHHDGYRINPIRCRDGISCSKLKDKEHLIKYAHEDDATKVCKAGGECTELQWYNHRLAFEHPGYRREPVKCKYGAGCPELKDRRHLVKYAHDESADGAPTPTTTPAPTPTTGATLAKVATDLTLMASTTSLSTKASTAGPTSSLSSISITASKTTITAPASGTGKTLADVPLELASDSVLIEVNKDSEEFWELEEKFHANLQGRNEDYVEKRIKAGKKPLRFILIGAEKVVNPILEERFELKKAAMAAIRDSKDVRERVSFHGTHPKNIKSILKYGLLRFQHPLNPCKNQVDEGYFGSNKKGIYVSRYADYTLKYSNRVCSVDEGDEVKTIMFRTLPGKSKHIPKLTGAIDPTEGYDSHSSPTFLEWYLFDEAQLCPQYVLKIKSVVDTRTAADDE